MAYSMYSEKPRITHHAVVKLGFFLDTDSPTKQDWRMLASYLKFTFIWIQKIESECLPTGKSPTCKVLHAWQETIAIHDNLPVALLIFSLKHMNRIDAASCVEQMMKDGNFLDSVKMSSPHCRNNSPSQSSGLSNQTNCHACQTGHSRFTNTLHTPQTNDSSRSYTKSPQENSYHGPSHPFLPQGHLKTCMDCERRINAPMYSCEMCEMRSLQNQQTSATHYQPHQPKNGQSVVSLSSGISDKSENLPMHRNNTNTWPMSMKAGAHDRHLSPSHVSSRIRDTHFHKESNDQQQQSKDDDSLEDRPYHSLVSVDNMMMENPVHASPNQTCKTSVLITYAYKNYKTAHALARLLMDRGHEVTVDNKASSEDCKQIIYHKFTSVTHVIIIYTPEYCKEINKTVRSPLNTCFIYDLMVREFKRLGNRNRRFVPIFDYDRIDRDSIPDLLRSYPKQPTQYICKILDNSMPAPKHGEISIQRKVYSSH